MSQSFSEAQIIRILQEVEGATSKSELLLKYGVSESSYELWSKVYESKLYLENGQLKQLEEENESLRQLVVEQALANETLRMVLKKLDVKLGSCPICRGRLRLWRYKLMDNVRFRIDTCVRCGFGMVNPRPLPEALRAYYQHQGHSQWEANTRTTRDIEAAEVAYPNSTLDAKRIVGGVKELLGKGGRMLDIGSGYGFFAREALKQGFDVVGLEMAEEERSISREIAGIEPINAMFEEYESDLTFDAIIMSQVLEHSANPVAWMVQAHRMLVPGGIIAIAVPNFNSLFRFALQDRDPYIVPPAHLNYFSPKNLRLLVEKTGFHIERTHTVSRLPPHLLARRLHLSRKPVVAVLDAVQRAVPKTLDSAALGMFINVFARKI